MEDLKDIKLLNFSQKGDERGHMVIVEGNIDIPFEIKRVFYIYGSDSKVVRGKHANLYSEFVLINVAGTSKIKVIKPDKSEAIYSLDKPHCGIYLPKMTWKEMYDFSSDSVLLCLSDHIYDANEYIRDFDDYIKIVNNK